MQNRNPELASPCGREGTLFRLALTKKATNRTAQSASCSTPAMDGWFVRRGAATDDFGKSLATDRRTKAFSRQSGQGTRNGVPRHSIASRALSWC